MLVLKMMNDQDLSDDNTSKGFMLFVCPHEVGFKRVDGIPYATFINHEQEIVDIEMCGNAYVMQNGKTIASYAYSNYETQKNTDNKNFEKCVGDKAPNIERSNIISGINY